MRAESEPRTRRHRERETESEDDRARFEKKDTTNVHNGKSRRGNKTSTGININNNGARPTRARSRHRSASRDRQHIQHKQQRSRAKSAPARCRQPERSKSHNTNNNTTSTKHPKEFYCPLSKRIMRDPVVDPEGNAYEREAIERWLRVQSSSPVTNGYLTVEMLRPSKELKSKIYKVVGEFEGEARNNLLVEFQSNNILHLCTHNTNNNLILSHQANRDPNRNHVPRLDRHHPTPTTYRVVSSWIRIYVKLVPNPNFQFLWMGWVFGKELSYCYIHSISFIRCQIIRLAIVYTI
jgi:hypothetical protein